MPSTGGDNNATGPDDADTHARTGEAADAPAQPPRPRAIRQVRRMIVFLLVLYGGWLLTLIVMQDRLIFPGRHLREPLLRQAPPGVEALWRDIDDGRRVEAWYVRAPNATEQSPAPLAIFAHGNGELIDDHLALCDAYGRLGISTLLVEYRGYGRSGGAPSQHGLVEDVVAFHDRVADRPEVDGQRLVYHGRSLGGGVVAELAVRRKPAAMILESTFTSLRSMTRRYLAPGFLVRHPFDVKRAISNLDVPILILHGERDAIIPVTHARKLARAVPHAQLVEMPAGHNNFPVDEDAYWQRIATFLRESGLLP